MIMRTILVATILSAGGAMIGFGQADHPPVAKQTQDKPRADQAKKPEPHQSANSTARGGAMIFIDPVTGQVREPDASEIGALSGAPPAATTRIAPPNTLVFVQGPGNAVGLKLGDDSMSYMVATRAPDGTISVDCVTGDQAASSRVNSASPRAIEKPRKPQAPPQR